MNDSSTFQSVSLWPLHCPSFLSPHLLIFSFKISSPLQMQQPLFHWTVTTTPAAAATQFSISTSTSARDTSFSLRDYVPTNSCPAILFRNKQPTLLLSIGPPYWIRTPSRATAAPIQIPFRKGSTFVVALQSRIWREWDTVLPLQTSCLDPSSLRQTIGFHIITPTTSAV